MLFRILNGIAAIQYPDWDSKLFLDTVLSYHDWCSLESGSAGETTANDPPRLRFEANCSSSASSFPFSLFGWSWTFDLSSYQR
jgi:hypothetical protein